MAAEGYTLGNGSSQKPYRMTSSQAISPISQSNNPFDGDLGASGFPMGVERASGRSEMESAAAIHIRKLPRHTNGEALRTMLLFAKDFIGADFVNSDSPSDQGYLSAIARFRSNGAAEEAKSLLNGKQNSPNEPPIQVEIYRLSPSGGLGPSSRNNFDMASNRAYSSSSTASSTGQTRPSRFNGTFQAIDRISPPNAVPSLTNGNSYSSAERSDVVSPMSSFFSPQSPIGQQASDRQRVSGKSVIGEDSIDDEPGDLPPFLCQEGYFWAAFTPSHQPSATYFSLCWIVTQYNYRDVSSNVSFRITPKCSATAKPYIRNVPKQYRQSGTECFLSIGESKLPEA